MKVISYSRFIIITCLFSLVYGQVDSSGLKVEDAKYDSINEQSLKRNNDSFNSSRILREWTTKYFAIDFKDDPYTSLNQRQSDYVGGEVILSKDGTQLAVRGSGVNSDSQIDNFYALYINGEDFKKNEWVYHDRPGEFERRNIPGTSMSLSHDLNSIAVGNSRCDAEVERQVGFICVQTNGYKGPDYNNIKGSEYGKTWGKSVSLSEDGTHVAVGSSEGKVYVYKVFQLIFSSDLDGAREGPPIVVGDVNRMDNTLGQLVKMAGDKTNPIVIIGGKGDVVRAYKYSQINKDWEKIGGDIKVDGTGDVFDVSLDGNIVAVAYNATTVRVYETSISSDNRQIWVLKGEHIEVADDKSISLSLSKDGNIVAIGAYNANRVGGDPGYVRIYEFDDDWIEMSLAVKGKEDAQDDVDFARSISLSGDGKLLAVAAPSRSQVDKEKGYAMVFEVGDPFPSLEPSSKPSSMPSNLHLPTTVPSSSMVPSTNPTVVPTSSPIPSMLPTSSPSASAQPSSLPSISSQPSMIPSTVPSTVPSFSSKPTISPSSTPSTPPSSSPTTSPSSSPTTSPTTSPSSTPSYLPSPTPSSSPTSSPTPSACLFNCECKAGRSCDLSQCLYNCNCNDGHCDMPFCTYDCRCEGGNCDMRRCGSNCQCDKRGCRMDNCIYNSRCTMNKIDGVRASTQSSRGISIKEIKGGGGGFILLMISLISSFFLAL